MSESETAEVLIIRMQGLPERFGCCYECKDGLHDRCIGVPCDCPCPDPSKEQRRAMRLPEWMAR